MRKSIDLPYFSQHDFSLLSPVTVVNSFSISEAVFAPSADFKKTYSEKSFFQYKKPKAEANDITVYSVGDRVKHTVFGEGMILSVTKMSSDYMYEIAFDNVGTKKLMATYASKLLTKI